MNLSIYVRLCNTTVSVPVIAYINPVKVVSIINYDTLKLQVKDIFLDQEKCDCVTSVLESF